MTGATPPAASAPDDRLAIAIQSLYKARGLSLADPQTAAAYDVAVQAVALLLIDGTYKTGGLGQEEHRRLRALLDAAALVPGYLSGADR
ncbi:hypothetical protein [Streptomyces platensis]|uniref:hypothetical protein n=1 Tax=Streptomyces platensis TaxID=58346 RepID=UPI00332CA325